MSALAGILARASQRPHNVSEGDLAFLVALEDAADRDCLYAAAYALKVRTVGRAVAVRALIEWGNACSRDCLYCGIRRSNAAVRRYRLSADEIVALAREARAAGYASLVLQSGEIASAENTRFVEDVLRRLAPLDLGITLSLGEQDEDTYRRWKAAGAARYLLRIETSSPALYARLHPAGHDWQRRADCLKILRRCGYQVGTGVMSALPGQTPADLARDIRFFADTDADMIGMGPYIPHPDTPLARVAPAVSDAERLRIALNMIAATRLYLHDVNIAATTALQALARDGREQGLKAGANVLMPNVTGPERRAAYELYAGKPKTRESGRAHLLDLDRRLRAFGEEIAFDRRGDSPHFGQFWRGKFKQAFGDLLAFRRETEGDGLDNYEEDARLERMYENWPHKKLHAVKK